MIESSRVGIFGGTFDPPHIGHLILAAEAADQLSLDKVLWVLTPDPPHKQGQDITPLVHRLRMVESTLEDNSIFELSRVEIERTPPHYALDTVIYLRQQFPSYDLIYLIGGDSLRELPTWHHPHLFVDACDAIGVMYRPGEKADLKSLDIVLPGILEKLEYIHAPLLEISSSEIRKRVAQGRAFQYYVPSAVYRLIHELNLYTTP